MLQNWRLTYNNLKGVLLDERLRHLTALLLLRAAQNYELTGSLPVEVAGGLSRLWDFSASHNQLAGTLPELIGSMRSMR
eukprot:2460301-Amphidinium_carterae.1